MSTLVMNLGMTISESLFFFPYCLILSFASYLAVDLVVVIHMKNVISNYTARKLVLILSTDCRTLVVLIKNICRNIVTSTGVIIYTDSQTAISYLESKSLNSQTVLDRSRSLNEMTVRFNISVLQKLYGRIHLEILGLAFF